MTAALDLDLELAELPPALSEVGFVDFIASFTNGSARPEAWGAGAELVDAELRSVVGLLLLNEVTPIRSLPDKLQRVVRALATAGICTVGEGHAQLPGLVLMRVSGVWLFVQRPEPSPTLYFGDDSVGLIERLDPGPGRCLDLCAGPGVQALVLASRGRPVVAVDINPVAAALGRINAGINGFTERVEFRCGNLYDAVPGEAFDTVTANPPLLPIPEGVPYPFVGDGGPDGLRLVRRILDGLPRHLTEQGRAQIIGITLSDGFLPLAMEELTQWGKRHCFDLTLTVTSHLPTGLDDWWVQGVAATAAAHTNGGYDNKRTVDDMRSALTQGYAAAAAPYVCVYALRAARGTGQVRYLDLSAARQSAGLWFI